MNEGLRGIGPYEDEGIDSPEFRIGGQTEDHSNTPIIHDGIGYIIRGEESHTEQGFVIFLDALGMKGIWEDYPIDQVFRVWKNSVGAFMDSLQLHQSGLNATYQFRVLSDTIIITIPTTLSDFSIVQVFDLLLEPFMTSIKNHVLFRGTIRYDWYFISPRLILGPALDEAAIHNNKLKQLKSYRSVVLDWPLHDTRGACRGILQSKYGTSTDKEKYLNAFEFYNIRHR